jgi:hypothetical protein
MSSTSKIMGAFAKACMLTGTILVLWDLNVLNLAMESCGNGDVYSCMQSEMLDPFIMSFFIFGFVLSFLSEWYSSKGD